MCIISSITLTITIRQKNMRYRPAFFTILLLTISTAAFAGNLKKTIRSTFEKISEDYIRVRPLKTAKRALIVMPFTELGKKAKEKELGNTVREIFSQNAVNSQVFYLVDRDTLEASVRELRLSMTGLISEESVIRAGRLANAQVFLAGTISEIQDRFMLSVKLIDAETGKVLAQETAEIQQKELIEVKHEIAFAYMAKHGIGINFQYSIGFIDSPADYLLQYADVFMNYRPYLWLNFKLGVTFMDLGFNGKKNITAQKVFPTLPGTVEPVDYSEGDINEVSPYVGADFNYTPTEKFTLGLGIGLNYFREPVLTQHYSPLYYEDSNTGGTTEKGGVFDVIQEMKPLYLLRLEVKPQYFITPRMTVGLYFACIFANRLKVYKTLVNNEYSGFVGEDSGTSQHEKEMQAKYYNIPLKILADGKNVNDVNLNMSMAAGLSFNFYF